MKKIKYEHAKVLEDIIGKKWKKIPQVNRIEWGKSGVKIKDGDIIGLGLYNTKLATLPESIGNLTSLTYLRVRSNLLTTLPESIGNLKSLQKLYLGDNKLATLPDSIVNLSSLKSLWLPYNQLTTLPESIGNLTSLTYLRVRSNLLMTLPESIGNLKSLKLLDLSNNQLRILPKSITNLQLLKELGLEGNPLNQEFKKILKMANGDVPLALRYKIEKPIIKKLIQELKFSDVVLTLKNIKKTAKRYTSSEIISWIDKKLDLCKELEASELRKRYPTIEKLIQEMKFSDAVLKLKDIRNLAKQFNLDKIINWSEKNLEFCNKHIIRKKVLNLGIKFTRLQIAEISEVCAIKDEQLIIEVIKDMINNKEIYAQYFSSSKAVAFDQQANIEEIDKLMASYEEWEEKEVGKK